MTIELVPQPPWKAAAVERVRQRMHLARCVFDFGVYQLPDVRTEASEEHHRAVLRALFETIEAKWVRQREEFLALHPAYSGPPSPLLSHRTDQVQPSSLNTAAIMSARETAFRDGAVRPWREVAWFQWLGRAFDDPPYGATCSPELFADFCEATGLLPGQQIEVLDWVGDGHTEPHRSA